MKGFPRFPRQSARIAYIAVLGAQRTIQTLMISNSGFKGKYDNEGDTKKSWFVGSCLCLCGLLGPYVHGFLQCAKQFHVTLSQASTQVDYTPPNEHGSGGGPLTTTILHMGPLKTSMSMWERVQSST